MRSSENELDETSPTIDTGPRSPLRTVQILRELSQRPDGLALGILAAHLQLPKTSVFRLLKALEAGGYVISTGGVHRIGPESIKLGTAIVQNRVFPNCARPVMQWLSGKSEETIIIGTMCDDGMNVVYSEVIEAINPLRFTLNAGTVKPLYCSASGLAILAYMPAPEYERYIKSVKFQKLAPNTISSSAGLARKLKEIRATGTAISVDGMFEGVYSIAAPIFDVDGRALSGISISAPSMRGLKHEAAFKSWVSEAGEEISRILGYTGVYP